MTPPEESFDGPRPKPATRAHGRASWAASWLRSAVEVGSVTAERRGAALQDIHAGVLAMIDTAQRHAPVVD